MKEGQVNLSAPHLVRAWYCCGLRWRLKGRTGESYFYAMEFVEGGNLMKEGQVNLREPDERGTGQSKCAPLGASVVLLRAEVATEGQNR
jgi:hypothetical protein